MSSGESLISRFPHLEMSSESLLCDSLVAGNREISSYSKPV